MNFLMPIKMEDQYFIELEKYRKNKKAGNDDLAWSYLERAHVIGQYHPIPHFAIHFRMLVFGIRKGNFNEILGQIPRLAVGWIGSLFNRIPVGNTGGANIHILASMPIPEDLRELLSDADVSGKGLSGIRKKG
ncbi:MAG: DUF3703 domain-containing protein [Leptospiraceae bacterium]|nr:DUF3703 domain-containing protein [Leptospiraceae bacterium]